MRKRLSSSVALIRGGRRWWGNWLRHAAGGAFVIVALLSLWSVTASSFVPSTAGYAAALVAAFAIGIAVSTRELLDRQPDPSFGPGREGRVLRVVFAGLFAGYLVFEGVHGGVLDFLTRMSGKPGEITMHLGEYSNRSRFQCAGFSLLEAPFSLRRGVCAEYRPGEAPPVGTPVILRGQRSRFGINVASFSVGE